LNELNMGLFGKSLERDMRKEEKEQEREEELAQQQEQPQPRAVKKPAREKSQTAEMTPAPEAPQRVRAERTKRTGNWRTEWMNQLPVDDRMVLMSDYTKAVIRGHINMLVITGDPGIGKTYTVENLLKTEHKGKENEDWVIIKASATPKGVYNTIVQMAARADHALAKAEDSKQKGALTEAPTLPVIVFDDVPLWDGPNKKVFTDFMKALADTSDKRTVSWLNNQTSLDAKEQADGKMPASVEYRGGIIVISNEPESKIHKAVRDRAVCLPIEVNDKEMVQLMKTRLPHLQKEVPMELKRQVLEWIQTEYEGEEMSMRTLVKAIKIAHSSPTRWKHMVALV